MFPALIPGDHGRGLWCIACLALVGVAVPACAQAQASARDSVRDTTPRVPLPTIRVTAAPVAVDLRRIAQPTDVLAGPALRRQNGASLGETLEQLPGVRSLSMTTGIGKPVIRGLTNNRVVTLSNGHRTETQQWGHDHSPVVESADAERIDVVKGPASVLYGSDALGGVVNVVRKPLPVGRDGPPLRGRVSLAYHSANLSPSATVVGEGARGEVGVRASLTSRLAQSLRTPSGVLPNSGNRTTYGEIGVGWRRDAHDVSLTVSQRAERLEIADDTITAPGYSGYQRIATERATFEAHTPLGATAGALHAQVGWEQNRRSEFASADASTIALGLASTSNTGFVHWNHPSRFGITGTVGVAAQYTAFHTFGTKTLIPDSRTHGVGVYLWERREIADWSLSAGLRHDWRGLSTPGNEDLALAATSRSFGATTGTFGVVWRATAPVSLAANVARGFRAPSASDLFANGFHEGTRAFEIGDPSLRVEQSLNTDLALRFRTTRASGSVALFHNRIRDYIYLAPIGARGQSLDSLAVRQGDARLVGAEASASLALRPRVSLQVTSDVVRGTNTEDTSALPFVPPVRVAAHLRYDAPPPGWYAQAGSEWNGRQSRTFRNEFAPAAWSTTSVSFGRGVVTPRGVLLVDLSVRNVFDARYRDFMSRYKEFADAAGRAVVLRASVAL
jgi:iron complex outermembrane receptor protein